MFNVERFNQAITSPRGKIILIALNILLILAVAGSSFLKPAINWDVLGYAGAVNSFYTDSASEIHAAAYSDTKAFALKHPDSWEDLLTANPYRERMAANPNAFVDQLSYFKNRIVYTTAVDALSYITRNITFSTLIISAVSIIFVNLIILFYSVKNFDNWPAFLLVSLFTISPFLIDISRLSTPDAMFALFLLLAVVLLLNNKEYWAIVPLIIGVGVRYEIIIFNVLLSVSLLIMWFINKHHRKYLIISLILLISLPIKLYLDIRYESSGYLTVYYHTFVERIDYPSSWSGNVPISVFVKTFLKKGVVEGLFNGRLWLISALSIYLLYRVHWKTLFHRMSDTISMCLIGFLVLRIVLFPLVGSRVLTPVFISIVMVLLSTRVTQHQPDLGKISRTELT